MLSSAGRSSSLGHQGEEKKGQMVIGGGLFSSSGVGVDDDGGDFDAGRGGEEEGLSRREVQFVQREKRELAIVS